MPVHLNSTADDNIHSEHNAAIHISITRNHLCSAGISDVRCCILDLSWYHISSPVNSYRSFGMFPSRTLRKQDAGAPKFNCG